jgi:N,N'-diacetyllegionaminate synthase
MRHRNTPSLSIGGRQVGGGAPVFVIAEIGLNHGGSCARALEMVDAAADAGASAIKLQTLVAEELVAPACPAPSHVHAASLVDFFRTLELDERAHHAIAKRARARNLAVIATPLSLSAVDLLDRVGIDALKIASGDLTWDGLIRRCARSRAPLVISTGMSTVGEICHAVATARMAGVVDVALLHCVSAYPTEPGGENLRAIATLADMFDVPVGLSDHGDAAALPPAIALGASIYERHLMLEDDDDAVDAAVSSTPRQLRDLVRIAARTRASLGSGEKRCEPGEAPNRDASRRALYAARPLPAGTVVHRDDLIALRPAVGLAAARPDELVGVTLRRDVAAHTCFTEADLSGGSWRI